MRSLLTVFTSNSAFSFNILFLFDQYLPNYHSPTFLLPISNSRIAKISVYLALWLDGTPNIGEKWTKCQYSKYSGL
jgi:hypothetical protein